MAVASLTGTGAGTPRPRRVRSLLAIGGGVLAAGFLLWLMWFGMEQRARGSSGAASVPFRQVPDFTLGLFDGSNLHLAEKLAEGKPVVVNFWASWCVPCTDEAPIFEAAAQRNASRFNFVGVDVQDTDADGRAFIARHGVTYPSGAGDAGPISIQYGMRGVPETYFIAPDGHLVRKWNGPLTAEGLEQFLRELENASASPAS
jgi:cytochrome c biogenesis protein CcmG/thiol:disulfide interchange protein DsbE